MAAISLDTLRELTQHMEWADACVWRALLAHRVAVQDTRLRDLLLLHGVQAAVRSYYNDPSAAVASFDETTLRQRIVMPGLEPYEQRMRRRFDAPTLAETILQVVSHSAYHRGQVNARLREVGGEPPLADYIAWIWFGRPAPEWTPKPSR